MRQNALTSDTCLTLHKIETKYGNVVEEVESTLVNTGFPPHDWVVTENYAIFMATPAGGDLTPFLLGFKGPAECISFQKKRNTIVHFVPRKQQEEESGSASDKRRSVVDSMSIELPVALHPVHFANAWEEEPTTTTTTSSKKTIVSKMAEQGESLLGSWSKIKGGNFEGVPVQQLMRIVIKTTSGETGEERLEKSIAVEE
eukprot:11344521-Ditylum_brightwellii.AAC.1